MDSEYKLYIADSYVPATLPMERLAAYLAALARLLGEEANVHFSEIAAGSVLLKAVVDSQAQPKVSERVRAVRNGDGPKEARNAFDQIDEMLRQDNATGALSGDAGGVIIPFPGRTRPPATIFGPVRQYGTLDGQIYRLGGRDATIHVHIRDAGVEFTALETDELIAHQLGRYFLGPTLRFHGEGSWLRHGDGRWELKRFKITHFEELNEGPLGEVVAALRNVPGSRWGDEIDPVQTILRERHDEESKRH
jgi:hypothetical protein